MEEMASSISPSKNEEDKIICSIRTNEPHLKRAVENRQSHWYENKVKHPGGATIFDVKFEF